MEKWIYNSPVFECDKLNHDLLRFAPWSGHRNFVYDFMCFFKPQTVVELGSHYGCSAFTFAQAAKDFGLQTQMSFIDTWQGDDFTKKYDNDVHTIFTKTVESFYSQQNINMLRMTFDQANDTFENQSIDVIHIDGSHYYDDVKRDFETWLPKVKADGIIMLHDISSDIVLGEVMGSYKYWLELKEKYEYTAEFDFSWGLGIIFLDKAKYDSFVQVDLAKYQRINNALDVDFKDCLRKNYFQLKDKEMYIQDLLGQKEVLNNHLDAYKRSVEEKDNYAKELEKTVSGFEKAVAEYEENQNKIISDYENAQKKIVQDYENAQGKIVADYEAHIAQINKGYSDMVSGKDNYINELEDERQKLINRINELEKAYGKTISGRLNRLKNNKR